MTSIYFRLRAKRIISGCHLIPCFSPDLLYFALLLPKFSYEPSSYPFLAQMCLYFVQRLEQTFSGKKYMYYPQYTVTRNRKPGSNPQTAHVVSSEEIPRVLYECKTHLGHTPMQLTDSLKFCFRELLPTRNENAHLFDRFAWLALYANWIISK